MPEPRRLWLDLGGFGGLRGDHPPGAIDAFWQDHGLALLRTIMHEAGVMTDLASTRTMTSWQELWPLMLGYDQLLMNVRSYRMGQAAEAARGFKELNPDGKVLVGGMHATVSPEDMEACPDFDHICTGPGEGVIVDLARDPGAFPRIFPGPASKSMADWPRLDRTLWPRPVEPSPQAATWPLEASCGWGPPPVATVITSRVCPWRCSFCLTDDTVIHTLAGRKTIRELIAEGADNFEVFSCDADGNAGVGNAHAIRKTKERAPVWRVTLDDGTTFKATADHPLMIRDGSYRPVSELTAGVSLMPFNSFYKRIGKSRGEYLWMRTNPEGSYIPSWRWRVQREGAKLDPVLVVHHRNFNSKDNRLSNLEVMTRVAHQELHAKLGIGTKGAVRSPETRRKMGLAKLGNNNQRFRKPESLERQRQMLAEYNRTRDYSHSQETRDKIAAGHRGKKRSAKHREHDRVAALARWASRSPEQRAAIGRKISQTKRALNNHKIVSIEPAGYEDVYDLTVDGYHNFAVAGGVFVHNCNEFSYIENMERRSVDQTIDDLNDLDERHGPLGSVVIHDSMFFQNPPYLREWLDKYPKRARRVWPYWAAARADTVRARPDLFEALVRETNWTVVSIGFESGSTQVLQTLNKECTAEDNAFCIDLLNRIGDDLEAQGRIRPRFWTNIMFAVPGETKEQSFETMRMLRSIKNPIPTIAYYAPFPGSALGYQLIAEGKSLMAHGDHQRYAGQPKVKGIDYDWYSRLLRGDFDAEVRRKSWP